MAHELWAPNLRVVSHVSGSVGQPRHDHGTLWSATKFGQPSCYMDVHVQPRSLWATTLCNGHPQSFMRSHTIVWTPSNCQPWTPTLSSWTPTTFRGGSHMNLGAHKVIGRSSINVGTQDEGLLDVHTRYVGTQQRQDLDAQSCDQLHAFWTSTTL